MTQSGPGEHPRHARVREAHSRVRTEEHAGALARGHAPGCGLGPRGLRERSHSRAAGPEARGPSNGAGRRTPLGRWRRWEGPRIAREEIRHRTRVCACVCLCVRVRVCTPVCTCVRGDVTAFPAGRGSQVGPRQARVLLKVLPRPGTFPWLPSPSLSPRRLPRVALCLAGAGISSISSAR